MSLKLENPQTAINQAVTFLRQTIAQQGKSQAVIAVSGGIDSAVALTLLTQALGPEKITTLFLPYGDQSLEDGQTIADFNQIPATQQHTINIQSLVGVAAQTLGVGESDHIRFGNLKARVRMICVFDVAKKLDALVCGTENKSEHYLGYFTRFGDAASDIEPIAQWYKTQIRQVAESLTLPEIFLTKAPSAGLWSGQTDEDQLGFTYTEADLVMEQLLDYQVPASEIKIPEVSPEQVSKIVHTITSQSFKLKVPYSL